MFDIGMTYLYTGPSTNTYGFTQMLKGLRVARILRTIRVFRFFPRIRLMAAMIIESLESLFWLLVLLAGVLCGFAIILTQGSNEYRIPSLEIADPEAYDGAE